MSYDNSYSEGGFAYESQPATMGDVSYPEVVTTQTYQTQTYANYPVQGNSNQSIPVQTVSYNANASMGVDRVLAVVNRKRRRAGLPALEMDPALMTVAQQKSANRANRRITGHDNLPKGGAAVEGVGYAHGYSDLASQFNTCYLYSNGYRRAGAAISYDGSGRAYYTLLLR